MIDGCYFFVFKTVVFELGPYYAHRKSVCPDSCASAYRVILRDVRVYRATTTTVRHNTALSATTLTNCAITMRFGVLTSVKPQDSTTLNYYGSLYKKKKKIKKKIIIAPAIERRRKKEKSENRAYWAAVVVAGWREKKKKRKSKEREK